MAVYTVLEPPKLTGGPYERAERFVFIRDGFSWAAFLLTPLWLIYRRLWLGLIGYLVVIAALQVGLRLAGVGSGGRVVAGALIALLIGFEAASLRRWTLTRRRWRELGTVVGDGLDDAERRFFDAWIAGEATQPQAAQATATPHPFGHRSDVVGLFPEPGANR
jgi:uncharacterized protein DUF2628